MASSRSEEQLASVSDNRTSGRQETKIGDLADELVDVILDMLWQLETQRPVPEPQTSWPCGSAASTPVSGGTDGGSGSGGGKGSGRGAATAASLPADGGGKPESPTQTDQQQQPEEQQHHSRVRSGAAEAVAAWASYRLVCRRWDAHFRQKPLALRFEEPLSESQLSWLTSSPVIVHSLGFAPDEQRVFRVLGSYGFQARCSHALTSLCSVPLAAASDITTRLLDFPKLRHLVAVGAAPCLRFADLPPSLRVRFNVLVAASLPWIPQQLISRAPVACVFCLEAASVTASAGCMCTAVAEVLTTEEHARKHTQSLEVEGLQRCQLRTGLSQSGSGGAAEGSTPPAPGLPLPAAAPTFGRDGSAPMPAEPLPPGLGSISLTSSDTLQVYADWLAGLRGDVSLRCKDLVLPLPPAQVEGETRFTRIEALAALIAGSRVERLHLHFQELVLLDFVAAAFPVVVFILLEGSALLAVLKRNHSGAFDIRKADGSVTLVRRQA